MQKKQFHPTIAIAITVTALILLTPLMVTSQPSWHLASFSLPSPIFGGNLRTEYVPHTNSIYTFGGYVVPSGFTRDVVKVDLGQEQVSILTVPLPFSTDLHAVQTAYDEQNSKIYIFHFTDVYQFDPTAESFVNLGVTLPESVGEYAIAKYVPSENAIYVFGNRGSGGGNWTLRFEPTTLAVQQLSAAMQPSNNTSPSAGYCSASEVSYLFGGNWSSFSFDLIQKFDPTTGSFTTLPITLPTIAGAPVAEAVPEENAIYVFGGYDNTKNIMDVSKFDCLTETLAQLPSLPVGLSSAGAAYIPNERRIYILGGARTRGGGSATDAIYYLQLDQLNQPPVALCKNVMVNADANCQSEASIDDGSFDPDGDPITLTQDPLGPYPLGSTEVTLTVTDDKGASAQCTGTVTVVDDTPPEVTADLILRELKENRPGDRGRGDFEVACAASDNCAGVAASGLMQIPAGFDDPNVEIEFDFKPGAESEINFHENKNGELSIQLEGADEVVLRAQLADILAAGGVAVANGQLLDLRFRVRENKGQKFGFDFLNGVLVQEKVEGEDPQTITMLCTATDGSANAAAGSVDANFSPPSAAAKMGGVETFASENFGSAELPEGFSLAQNHPNPFNPTTTITFAVPEAGEVTLAIYNMRGQLIQTLQSGVIAAGQHRVVWHGTDFRGAKVASGIYLYKLQAKHFVATKKLVFTK